MSRRDFLCKQDQEDYEQEKKIQEWLVKSRPEGATGFDSKYINRKGNPRNTLIRASFSLDQNIRKNEPRCGTFADIVGGFDGRSLEDGNPDFHFQEHYESTLWETLTALGFKKGEILWLIKMWKHYPITNDLLSQTSMTDSEWENL